MPTKQARKAAERRRLKKILRSRVTVSLPKEPVNEPVNEAPAPPRVTRHVEVNARDGWPMPPMASDVVISEPHIVKTMKALQLNRCREIIEGTSAKKMIEEGGPCIMVGGYPMDAGILTGFALEVATRERELMMLVVRNVLLRLGVTALTTTTEYPGQPSSTTTVDRTFLLVEIEKAVRYHRGPLESDREHGNRSTDADYRENRWRERLGLAN